MPVHISFTGMSAPILCAAGPWFTSGMWWHETERWNREEWDIAIPVEHGVGLYRISHDQESRVWYVEGMYD